ncbi:MAG TPA: CocE/NonD family hydrolase [Bryobacteraceae bacterium]|jgi:putative CocE/NonD family hydrolase|nr:CocE/NonD family hydrolase [Bryobacteraceae bacterium]
MSLLSRVVGRLCRLPAPVTRRLATEPLRIPMRDGAELLADRYYSRGGSAQPTLLIRSCYGRGTLFKVIVVLFAERGMQVIVQSCRGTEGSQGTFRPFFDEQNDGEDTVKWMERQPWFSGELALWGISYLGNTAWAIANSGVKVTVKAIGLHVTLSNFRDRTYAFGGFTLLSCIEWTATMLGVIRTSGKGPLAALMNARKTRPLTAQAIETIPVRKADRVLTPEGVSWWQDWMDHAEPNDPWWDAIDYGHAAETIPATVMVAGWYDIFLPWQLKDFMAAQGAGRDVRIVIGPWMHAAVGGMAESLRQSIALFQEQFSIASGKAGDTPRSPVRLFLMGANEWREYPSWPIPNSTNRTYFLDAGGVLASGPPASENTSTFDYDPAHPTPSLHGPTLGGRSGSGDMAELEGRSDVLIFNTEPLTADLDAIGPIAGEIFLRSNTEHTDLYLCLCDVTPSARSSNVCDGYTRLRPELAVAGRSMADVGSRKVHVEFWPTAYRFRRGHRIRVIVASGAHPRHARNLGGDESLGDAQTMVIAHQEILHGPGHRSAIILSVQPT